MQVIAAEGEQKASRALRQAADVIAESSSALQVKWDSLKDFIFHLFEGIKFFSVIFFSL